MTSSPPSYEMPIDNDMSPPRSPQLSQTGPSQAPLYQEPEPRNIEKGCKRKTIALRSDVWEYFTLNKDENRAYCKWCPKNYAADPKNGTSTLHCHRKKCVHNPANQSRKENIGVQEGVDQTQWKFDPDAIRKALTEIIIMDELPFLFVENEGFRKFMKIVCPQFVVPSRTTITRDCMDLYRTEKKKLRAYFYQSNQMICFTTDMWTSNQRLSYLCLTAQFIDDNWKLCKRVLNFIPCSSHKGDDVGVLLEKCLTKWGIK